MQDMVWHKQRLHIEVGESGNYLLRTQSEPYGQERTHEFETADALMRYLTQFLVGRPKDSTYITLDVVIDDQKGAVGGN